LTTDIERVSFLFAVVCIATIAVVVVFWRK
jgi:hypothetical protein